MKGRKVSGGAAGGRRSLRCLRSPSRRVRSHFLDVGILRDAARGLGQSFGDHAAQADDLHFLGAVARLARGVGARVHRGRRAARGAGGQRRIDVARLDASGRARARDGRQIESGFGGAAPRGRRGHDATRLVSAGAIAAAAAACVSSPAGAAGFVAGAARCGVSGNSGGGRRRACRGRVAGGRGGGVGVEHHELGAHGHHVARLAADGEDPPGDRRRHLHRGLLGHDFAHDLVFLHEIAGLHVPGDHFGGDRAFTQVRHLEYVAAHGYSLPSIRPWPRAARAPHVPGRENTPIRRHADTGYPSRPRAGWATRDTRSILPGCWRDNSAPNPQKRVASCATTQRPVFLTEEQIGSMSSGDMVRTSMISASRFELLRRGLAHVHHGAVGHDGDLRAFAHDVALADGHGVVALGHVALGMRAPWHRRFVRVAVEGAVVDALGLEEDDRVVVLDGCDQQALGVVGIRRHHHLHAADVREDGLGTLRMRLAAADAAAAGRAHHHGRGEVTGRAVTDARQLAGDLVHRRVDVVGELDLRHRPAGR